VLPVPGVSTRREGPFSPSWSGEGRRGRCGRGCRRGLRSAWVYLDLDEVGGLDRLANVLGARDFDIRSVPGWPVTESPLDGHDLADPAVDVTHDGADLHVALGRRPPDSADFMPGAS